jgi:hypothetical protein
MVQSFDLIGNHWQSITINLVKKNQNFSKNLGLGLGPVFLEKF